MSHSPPVPLTKKYHLWGYEGVNFVRDPVTDTMLLQGPKEYEISGKPIPSLFKHVFTDILQLTEMPQIREQTDLSREYSFVETAKSEKMADHPTYSSILTFVKSIGIVTSTEGKDLLLHSHGQLSVEEIYKLFYDYEHDKFNICDIVVYPTTQEHIKDLYRLTSKYKEVKLIPYGGGTNVTGCLLIPSLPNSQIVISVDLSRFNKLLHIDTRSNFAIFQSGITGKELETQLHKHGFTSGHEPDSYEFSTLGGWIATNASGMKRGKYGNIEDIVIDFDVVNELTIGTTSSNLKPTRVRHSHGSEIKNMYFGHEGNFGIVTNVTIKVYPLPEVKKYNSLVFKTMSDGIAFLKDVNLNNLAPASLRLVDNNQFKLGQSLKPKKTWFKAILDKIVKFFLFYWYCFNINTMVATTIVMEGNKDNVKHQESMLIKTAKKYGGIVGGAENGRAGYNLTQAIAYIRDLFNSYGIICETFETSVEWDNIQKMTAAIDATIKAETAKSKTKYFISHRITQMYSTGVAVYYTFAIYNSTIDEYKRCEAAMRKTMIANGGSISHHHGVGKIKAKELDQFVNPSTSTAIKAFKNIIDPQGVFVAGNNHCA